MKEKRLFSKFTSSYVVKAMLIIYVAIMVVLNVNVNTTQAATDKIMFNGVWYYFVDDELVSEYEYWQAKVQEYRYYDAGKLVTMSDGTVLWYGACAPHAPGGHPAPFHVLPVPHRGRLLRLSGRAV
jgi:hypothetical protein